jgi:uncharacterized protein YlxW (UPF0749 family)
MNIKQTIEAIKVMAQNQGGQAMSEHEHTEHLLDEIERLHESNFQLREDAEDLKQRIKRLEDALEARASDNELNQAWELYIKTKEAKL